MARMLRVLRGGGSASVLTDAAGRTFICDQAVLIVLARAHPASEDNFIQNGADSRNIADRRIQ